MKTCEEKAQSVLIRIEEEREHQRRKKKAIIRVVIPIMSFCLIVALVFITWQTGLFKNTTSHSDNGASNLDGNNYSSDTTLESSTNGENEISEQDPAEKSITDQIVINNLNELPATDKMNIALMDDDFVKMDKSELTAYYGTNIFPIVPNDLKSWDTADDFGGYGIYRRNGGTGEVYYDTIILNYSNDNFSRTMNIELEKGSIPFQDFVVDTTKYQKSIISGQQVIIGLDVTTNTYFIGLMHDNVGFAITAYGLTQDEVVEVVRSIIE